MKKSVLSLKEKNNTTLVFLLSNCPQVELLIVSISPTKMNYRTMSKFILFCALTLNYRPVLTTLVIYFRRKIVMEMRLPSWLDHYL